MTVLLSRAEIEEKLRPAFAPEQAASLVEIFDNMRMAGLERAADTRDLKQGLRELTEEVKKLAAAQQCTDERLAAFQQRTDEQFVELATAQQHTDETVAELGRAVQALTETVHTGLTELRQIVGSLANTFEFDLEEFVSTGEEAARETGIWAIPYGRINRERWEI